MQVQGQHYDSRAHAAAALARWAERAGLKWAVRYTNRDHGPIGQIGGFAIHLALRPGRDGLEAEITLDGAPRSSFSVPSSTLLDGQVGVIQRIENRVAGIPTLLAHAREELAAAGQTILDAGERIGQPFRHAEALRDAERRLGGVEGQLAAVGDQEPGRQDPPEAELEAGCTVEALHGRHPQPAGPAPLERPTPPRFVPAVRQGRELHQRSGLSR